MFLTVGLRKWQEDPEATDARMSRRCSLIPRCIKLATDTSCHSRRHSKPWSASDWDKNPKIAKLEKILCTYYTSGIGEKMRSLMHLMERNPAEYELQEGSVPQHSSLSPRPPPPSSLTATRHDFRRPIQPNKRYLCRYLQNRRRIFQGQSCIHPRFAAGLNRFSSENRSHIDQRRAHGIRENVTAILLYPLSAGAFHCIGKPLTALTRYYKVRC
jgi:hypothetical protein